MNTRTFTLKKLPHVHLNWEKWIGLLGQAHEAVTRYDELHRNTAHSRTLLSLLTTREAVLSMETQHRKNSRVVLEDVLVFDAIGKTSPKKKAIVTDIVNWRSALNMAKNAIDRGPLSLRLIRKIHASIRKNSETAKKDIGIFRNRQNWIGPMGCSIDEAYFYPPPAHLVKKAMANLEKYINYKEKDTLVQLAIFFVQFLIIHPFMDGNGRVSRILIPLFLAKKNSTSGPVFFMSKYFQKNRLKYLEKLYNTSMKNEWEGWIKFFLEGIVQEGANNLEKTKKILKLHHSLRSELSGSIPSKTLERILNSLFLHPVFTEEKFARHARLPKHEATKILKLLKAKKIIRVVRKHSIELMKFQSLIKLVRNSD